MCGCSRYFSVYANVVMLNYLPRIIFASVFEIIHCVKCILLQTLFLLSFFHILHIKQIGEDKQNADIFVSICESYTLITF